MYEVKLNSIAVHPPNYEINDVNIGTFYSYDMESKYEIPDLL